MHVANNDIHGLVMYAYSEEWHTLARHVCLQQRMTYMGSSCMHTHVQRRMTNTGSACMLTAMNDKHGLVMCVYSEESVYVVNSAFVAGIKVFDKYKNLTSRPEEYKPSFNFGHKFR